ncbi:MAG TPA: gamma-glutamyl-gamma-aminobutyrate hydrolase family protein [Candidatus Nanopelagicales bacterium]|nr:gamma-glutamyl-gamma-aminobutyrate hydrolase family protein [Candidatus Nanopelagicales bacterium]
MSNPSASFADATVVRLERSSAEILLPFAGANLRDYVARLRDAAIFPDAGEALDALAGWPMAEIPDAESFRWLRRGRRDAWAWQLQTALIRLSALWSLPELSPGPADGDLGERTEGAVLAFQRRRGLTVDGVAGPQTLGALEAALAEQGVTAIPLLRVDPPRVGVVLAHPAKLVPGRDEEVTRLVGDVIRLGCRPLLIPPCADVLAPAAERSAAVAVVRELDGLLGPGGDDVDPAIYGEPDIHAENTNYRRDRFEADLALAAMRAPMYLFGICRSHQLWNAAAGGSLVQDVQAEGFSSLSQRQGDFGIAGDAPFVVRKPDGGAVFENLVELEPHSEIARILGGPRAILTNSYHHQAVDVPGEGFTVVGTVWDPGTQRRTIEATERWNAITTQFHPEVMLRDPMHREMYETLGRRARVLRMLKAGAGDGEALLARMGQHPAGHFDDSDLEWVRRELAPRIVKFG